MLPNKIQNKLEKIIKIPYYYVSPCNVCGSRKTGRYIRLWRDTNAEWQINESLRNGELVKPVPELGNKNCFCGDCGFEWYENVELSFFPIKRIKEEKTARLTREMLAIRMEKFREEERKDHRPLKSVRKFIGKI